MLSFVLRVKLLYRLHGLHGLPYMATCQSHFFLCQMALAQDVSYHSSHQASKPFNKDIFLQTKQPKSLMNTSSNTTRKKYTQGVFSSLSQAQWTTWEPLYGRNFMDFCALAFSTESGSERKINISRANIPFLKHFGTRIGLRDNLALCYSKYNPWSSTDNT